MLVLRIAGLAIWTYSFLFMNLIRHPCSAPETPILQRMGPVIGISGRCFPWRAARV